MMDSELNSDGGHCSVCDQCFPTKLDRLRHFLQEGHQILARKGLLSWGEIERSCALVIFGKLPVGEDVQVIDYLSSRGCGGTFVSDFVWWPERPRIGFARFKDKEEVKFVVSSLEGRQFQIGPGQLYQVKEGWAFGELEWRELFPEQHQPLLDIDVSLAREPGPEVAMAELAVSPITISKLNDSPPPPQIGLKGTGQNLDYEEGGVKNLSATSDTPAMPDGPSPSAEAHLPDGAMLTPAGPQVQGTSPGTDTVSMEEGNNERNPLLNEDILEHVLKYVVNQHSDIQSVRPVCKLWNYCATKLFRRHRRAMVFGPDGYSDHQMDIDESVARMRSFLSTMRNSRFIPVQEYRISIGVFLKEEGDALLNDFLQICGPDAVSLSLFISYDEYFVHGTFNLEQVSEVNLVNLKYLSLSVYPKDLSIRELQELNLLTGLLLESATTLQSFSYNLFIQVLLPSQIIEVKKLEQNIVARIPQSVKTLTLSYLCNENLAFQNLTRRRLQLRNLTLQNNVKPTSTEDSEIIHKFLQSQTDSLQHLELINYREIRYHGIQQDDVACKLELPRLSELLSLKLSLENVAPFCVLERCPKLRRLDVEQMSSEFFPTLTNTTEPSLSLKELCLPYSFPLLMCSFRSLSCCFPQLNELHVMCGGHYSQTLEPVFTYFPRITHLKISFSSFDEDDDDGRRNLSVDSFLAGTTEEECRRIGELPFPEFLELNISDQLQLKPSILNLKLLRKLEIENYGRDDTPTDITVKLFLELPVLEELSVIDFEFSSTYFELLNDRLTEFLFYRPWPDEDESSDDEGSLEDVDTDEDEEGSLEDGSEDEGEDQVDGQLETD